jgi:hypothetical protein
MIDEDEPAGAWIDYLVGSDDPADKATLDEYCALSWEHGQTSQWMLTTPGSITETLFEKMTDQQRRADELQKRIFARAQILKAEGKLPATGETLKAWVKQWRTLAQTHPDHDAPPMPEA